MGGVLIVDRLERASADLWVEKALTCATKALSGGRQETKAENFPAKVTTPASENFCTLLRTVKRNNPSRSYAVGRGSGNIHDYFIIHY